MVVAASQKSIEGNVFKACRRDKAGFACKGSDDGLSVIASFALFFTSTCLYRNVRAANIGRG